MTDESEERGANLHKAFDSFLFVLAFDISPLSNELNDNVADVFWTIIQSDSRLRTHVVTSACFGGSKKLLSEECKMQSCKRSKKFSSFSTSSSKDQSQSSH